VLSSENFPSPFASTRQLHSPASCSLLLVARTSFPPSPSFGFPTLLFVPYFLLLLLLLLLYAFSSSWETVCPKVHQVRWKNEKHVEALATATTPHLLLGLFTSTVVVIEKKKSRQGKSLLTLSPTFVILLFIFLRLFFFHFFFYFLVTYHPRQNSFALLRC
jgi:hypothetical protein